MLEDLTCLFTRIYKGDSADGPPFGSGILHFKLLDLPSMLFSFKVTNASSLGDKIKAISQFYLFCYGEIGDTYLSKLSPLYNTEYENLVLNGELSSGNGEGAEFLLFLRRTR